MELWKLMSDFIIIKVGDNFSLIYEGLIQDGLETACDQDSQVVPANLRLKRRCLAVIYLGRDRTASTSSVASNSSSTWMPLACFHAPQTYRASLLTPESPANW